MIDERWYPDDPDDDDWMSIEEFDDNVAAIAEWARNADRTGTLRKDPDSERFVPPGDAEGQTRADKRPQVDGKAELHSRANTERVLGSAAKASRDHHAKVRTAGKSTQRSRRDADYDFRLVGSRWYLG